MGNVGYLRTFTIPADGSSITSESKQYLFPNDKNSGNSGYYNSTLKIDSDNLLVKARDRHADGWVRSYKISNSGKTLTEDWKLEFEPTTLDWSWEKALFQIDKDTYGIAYSDNSSDGQIKSLNIKKKDLVLEVGTGTGYQTALLSYLCKHVFTIEIFEKLINQAKINHAKLNLKNISYLLGDGSNGWNKAILFDSIIISAASKKVSPKLLKTLKTKGKIIFPKKYSSGQQKLLLLKKLNERNYSTQKLFDVKFVPLL